MPIDYRSLLRAEAARMAAAARRSTPTATVPSCPGWDLAALVAHTGRVHRWACQAIANRPEPAGGFPKAPAEPEALAGWFDEGVTLLDAALAELPADAPTWNFASAPAVGAFWPRRQALETAVHRWDAEAAAGLAPAPIDAELAADGIDELLTVFAPWKLAQRDGVDLGGSLHLHCTDTEGEWTLHTDDGVLRVVAGHAKGDCAVRGPAADLYLALWRRLPADHPTLERFGDTSVFDRWLALGV